MSSPFHAQRFHAYGPPTVLQWDELPRPQPGPGEVLIKVRYAGVNPIDWKLRSGRLQSWMPLTLPAALGIDVAGTVEACGPGVTGFDLGQAVFGCGTGTYAELALAKAADLAAVPPGLGLDVAAALPVGGLTAWSAVEAVGLRPGQRVLVQGAAGGVGLFAVQLAKLKGAWVTGTASAANRDFVRSLGADQALDYAAGPLDQQVSGLDVVIDTVGGPVLEGSYALLKQGGTVVTVAGQLNDEQLKAFGLKGLRAGRGPASGLSPLADLCVKGQIRAEIQKVFALRQAADAHQLSESGHGRGRILLEA